MLLGATSADPAYNGIDPADVSVTNTDNDLYAISGTVLEDVDGDGLVSDDGAGLANALVSLYRDDGDGVIDAGDTIVNAIMANASGQYAFNGLENATYWVVANSRSFPAQRASTADTPSTTSGPSRPTDRRAP